MISVSVLWRATYAKWLPNAKGANRPKNKADKSSLLVNGLNRELTYRNRSWVVIERAGLCNFYLLDHPLQARKGVCEWSWGDQKARHWQALAPGSAKRQIISRAPCPQGRSNGNVMTSPKPCTHSRVHLGEGEEVKGLGSFTLK